MKKLALCLFVLAMVGCKEQPAAPGAAPSTTAAAPSAKPSTPASASAQPSASAPASASVAPSGSVSAAPSGSASAAAKNDMGPEKVVFTAPTKGNVTFKHEDHQGRDDCKLCHHERKGEEKAKPCRGCHVEKEGEKVPKALAVKDAFHKTCKGCHEKDKNKKAPTKCPDCHKK